MLINKLCVKKNEKKKMNWKSNKTIRINKRKENKRNKIKIFKWAIKLGPCECGMDC